MAEPGDIIELTVSVVLTDDMTDIDALGWAGQSVDLLLAFASQGLGHLIDCGSAKRLCSGVSVRRHERLGPRKHRAADTYGGPGDRRADRLRRLDLDPNEDNWMKPAWTCGRCECSNLYIRSKFRNCGNPRPDPAPAPAEVTQ
jgi:hypothetical protein